MKLKFAKKATLLVGAMALAGMAWAQQKPAELKVGITTFLSGPASVFGVPAKAAAEILIDDLNAQGGIAGVKITPVFIDEGLGGDKLLSEYRRVVQDQGVRTTFSAISSGNCNIVAPVAEDLKVLNVMWDCGTEKLLEEKRYQYVLRTQANATTEMVATVLYLMKTKPNFETIAVVNQDYAWGQDSRKDFMLSMANLYPEAKPGVDQLPKFGAGQYGLSLIHI